MLSEPFAPVSCAAFQPGKTNAASRLDGEAPTDVIAVHRCVHNAAYVPAELCQKATEAVALTGDALWYKVLERLSGDDCCEEFMVSNVLAKNLRSVQPPNARLQALNYIANSLSLEVHYVTSPVVAQLLAASTSETLTVKCLFALASATALSAFCVKKLVALLDSAAQSPRKPVVDAVLLVVNRLSGCQVRARELLVLLPRLSHYLSDPTQFLRTVFCQVLGRFAKLEPRVGIKFEHNLLTLTELPLCSVRIAAAEALAVQTPPIESTLDAVCAVVSDCVRNTDPNFKIAVVASVVFLVNSDYVQLSPELLTTVKQWLATLATDPSVAVTCNVYSIFSALVKAGQDVSPLLDLHFDTVTALSLAKLLSDARVDAAHINRLLGSLAAAELSSDCEVLLQTAHAVYSSYGKSNAALEHTLKLFVRAVADSVDELDNDAFVMFASLCIELDCEHLMLARLRKCDCAELGSLLLWRRLKIVHDFPSACDKCMLRRAASRRDPEPPAFDVVDVAKLLSEL